jgi:heat-inducible transcriptional repressor
MKNLAKYIAAQVESAVIVALDRKRVFYTGLSQIMAQPEFREHENTMQVSQMLDRCEDMVADMFELAGKEPVVLVGSQNPFGESCAVVTVSLGKQGLIAIVGPMRMAYSRDVSMLEYIQRLIS